MASRRDAMRRVGLEGLACQETDLLHQLLILIRHGGRDSRPEFFNGKYLEASCWNAVVWRGGSGCGLWVKVD